MAQEAEAPAGTPTVAGQADAVEDVAARLLAATVTVRVSPERKTPAGGGVLPETPAARDVTVCSGVSLGRGLIVIFAPDTSNARFRVTLADGEQAEAKLSVVDHYSGLSLLVIEKPEQGELELAAELPRVGGAVLTAAAAGIESPIVSRGILGATDRLLTGTGLPPLLQCDVRTTETSSGAAVVDRRGRLIGVVAATAAPGERQGWAYAVPLKHVERVLRAYQAGQLVVLQRRRPTVGLTLGPGANEGSVEVERVEPGGPADRAGVRTGDVVLEADGRKLRSAYQAVELILKKQPGDEVDLVVRHGDETRSVKISLEGGSLLSGEKGRGSVLIGPQLRLRAVERRQIEVRNSQGVEEVGPAAAPAAGRMARDELSLLRAQLAAFDKVIKRLQFELARRDELQARTETQLQKLTEELIELRGRKNPAPDTPPTEP